MCGTDEPMEIFQVTLIVATFLCTLVAGFVFAFAAVVMPGMRSLDDGDSLRAPHIAPHRLTDLPEAP